MAWALLMKLGMYYFVGNPYMEVLNQLLIDSLCIEPSGYESEITQWLNTTDETNKLLSELDRLNALRPLLPREQFLDP